MAQGKRQKLAWHCPVRNGYDLAFGEGLLRAKVDERSGLHHLRGYESCNVEKDISTHQPLDHGLCLPPFQGLSL